MAKQSQTKTESKRSYASLLKRSAADIAVLKKEVQDTRAHPFKPRTLKDFERIVQHSKGVLGDFNIRKELKVVAMPKGVQEKGLKELKENLEKTNRYFVGSMNMPLRYVLASSKKVVFTAEWVEALREDERIRILRSVERKRKQKVLFKKKNVSIADCGVSRRRMEILHWEKWKKERLQDICKSLINFFSRNTIYEDEDVRILKDGCGLLYMNDRPLSAGPEDSRVIAPIKLHSNTSSYKRFLETFKLMNSSAYKIDWNASLGKKGAITHSSHLNTLSKINPDLGKLYDPLSITKYKLNKKLRDMQMAEILRNRRVVEEEEMMNGNRGVISRNMAFNVNKDKNGRVDEA